MLKLTKTGIGLLTKQYRSVLKKCLLLNLGISVISILTNQSYATGTYGVEIGGGTAEGYAAVAIGIVSYATKTVDVALGHGSSASGGYSVALGGNSTANEYATVSVGWSDLKRRIVNVAAGQNDNDVVILKQLNDALNYYYTFRVDEKAEVIEFSKELRSNKKEMSSLDFMPIKSFSDLRINLIKAEDPLTFSAKTRDGSLVLMEVCHA